MTFAWQKFASLRLFTCLFTLETYCVAIALLRQSKPFPLLYLGHAQIINQTSTKIIIFDLGEDWTWSFSYYSGYHQSVSQSLYTKPCCINNNNKKRIRPTTTPQMSPLSKRPMAQSKERIMALLRRWVISLFKSIERPSSWKRKREILFPKKKTNWAQKWSKWTSRQD